MQDVPESAYCDSASADSVQSIIKIRECYRIPNKCGNSIQVRKRTKERNADLVTSLAEQSSTKQDQKETPRLLSSGRQSPKTLNKGRQYHVLLILSSRQESQQITNILPSCTLKKATVANVKRNRSTSKSNPGDSGKAHMRDSQLAHTYVKHVSGAYPPLYEGKKEIVV